MQVKELKDQIILSILTVLIGLMNLLPASNGVPEKLLLQKIHTLDLLRRNAVVHGERKISKSIAIAAVHIFGDLLKSTLNQSHCSVR